MTNNDIVRQIRYIFNYPDAELISICNLSGSKINFRKLKSWLSSPDSPHFAEIRDEELAQLLNGIILKNRGFSINDMPPIEQKLSNNRILRKLKIALSFTSKDMVDIIALTGFKISEHEINAFFRKPNQNQYRDCKDQIIRKFLYGLKLKFRQNYF